MGVSGGRWLCRSMKGGMRLVEAVVQVNFVPFHHGFHVSNLDVGCGGGEGGRSCVLRGCMG